MALVFASNDASESTLEYDDRTGVSYEFPSRAIASWCRREDASSTTGAVDAPTEPASPKCTSVPV
jgi:hypothetical protein